MKSRPDRDIIPMRIARELKDGDVVNIGFGLGSMTTDYVSQDKYIIPHAEGGVVGYGRVLGESEEDKKLRDYDLTNSSSQFVARRPGMCFMDIAQAIDAVRTGRVDVTVLGGIQVSENGDLANWSTDPRGSWGSIGGAMDIAVGVKKVIVGMIHTTKSNEPKIVKRCTLPLTAPKCVDLIVTELAVIEVTSGGLELKEVAPGWTVEEVQALTEPRLIARDVKQMEL